MQLEDLDKNNIPRHVAIIMDGNGRWAQQQQERRIFGHQHAITAVRHAVEAAVASKVQYLTLYAFSTENWNRPQEEVDGLMELLIQAVRDETKTMMDNNVRLAVIGDIDRIPQRSREKLTGCIEQTSGNTAMTLIVALSYSSRWEIAQALKVLCAEHRDPATIDEDTLRSYLTTKDYPDPDLLIRTGGEIRISNYLLWQCAYSEFYFCDTYWPDFDEEGLHKAIIAYQSRQRRFGKTEAQTEAEATSQNDK